jgi:hypothetical protein
VNRLDNPTVKADYQLELWNRFEILAELDNNDDINNETDVNKMLETIRDTVKSTAKERVDVRKQQRIKP